MKKGSIVTTPASKARLLDSHHVKFQYHPPIFVFHVLLPSVFFLIFNFISGGAPAGYEYLVQLLGHLLSPFLLLYLQRLSVFARVTKSSWWNANVRNDWCRIRELKKKKEKWLIRWKKFLILTSAPSNFLHHLFCPDWETEIAYLRPPMHCFALFRLVVSFYFWP